MFSQKNEKIEIKATINKLFAAMKAGDSTMARSVFHPNAILESVGFSEKTGKNYFHYERNLDGFIKSIGSPHAEVWEEIPGKYEIKIDNQLAQVWVPYEFYLSGKFSHCGVDIFTLYNDNFSAKTATKANWKIAYLIYTMRKEKCIK